MAKIKRTKGELKAQQEQLHRYQRFLPTLQLKKQQLQSAVQHTQQERRRLEAQQERLQTDLEPWIGLFAEDNDLAARLTAQQVRLSTQNIAGLEVPVLEEVTFAVQMPDPHATPPWWDAGLEVLQEAVRLQVKLKVLTQRETLLTQELRKTTQRVNLFEKIKIPECLENIRVVQIALGDLQTASVTRAKLAKNKMRQRDAAS
ncbi:MAG: V-type ATP synthase subunit D [Thermodesulfobacteriota bacterium]